MCYDIEQKNYRDLRQNLVNVTLKWQQTFGVAPAITSAISEYDAALLLGLPIDDYIEFMSRRTAVSRGADFEYNGKLYQIKANRPSGKRGSDVTKVPKAKNYLWDFLIWILYDKDFNIIEAWQWDVEAYKRTFEGVPRISPANMRLGKRIK